MFKLMGAAPDELPQPKALTAECDRAQADARGSGGQSMKVNRKYISPLTTDDLIRKIDAKRPGFAARVDARVSELALARRVKSLGRLRHVHSKVRVDGESSRTLPCARTGRGVRAG
jgi:hypothetical protein